MFTHRLTRAGAVALAIAAAAAPAAVARPADARPGWTLPPGFHAADTARGAVIARGLYEPIPPEEQPQPPQDLRMPDTIDAAIGRGAEHAPDVVVVKNTKPVAQPVADGTDWADIGLGAGGVMALSLIALGGGLIVVHRRGARQLPA
jgi:hypothetical protein